MLCGIFALSFLAGGVANAVYAADNAEIVDDTTHACELVRQQYSYLSELKDLCDDRERVRDSEAAAAVSCETYLQLCLSILIRSM